MSQLFCYSWLLPHVLSWTIKLASLIYELASSLLLWLLLIATMCLSSIDCSAYLLGCLVWAPLCKVPGAEYLCHKYFFAFHERLYLNFLLECVWVVACVILFCRDWYICIFCVSFILSENEWHIKYVFDPLIGVINIFCGGGVWTFINFIHWMILIDSCEH